MVHSGGKAERRNEGDAAGQVCCSKHNHDRSHVRRSKACTFSCNDHTYGQAAVLDADCCYLQSWSDAAEYVSDILAGVQQLSLEEYKDAARQAKARLAQFHLQTPSMALPNMAPCM